jgi:hypothetical protein
LIQVNDTAFPDPHSLAMNASFNVAVLSGCQVPLAFPLIQATWPGIDLASWLSFVEFFNNPKTTTGSAVLALRDSVGCICGVFAYRLARDLQAGRVLSVERFTAADLANSLGTVRALLEAAEMQALELGCAGVQIRLYNDQPALASRLQMLGLLSEAGVFWKTIDPMHTQN